MGGRVIVEERKEEEENSKIQTKLERRIKFSYILCKKAKFIFEQCESFEK